jgi:hypothetical protein
LSKARFGTPHFLSMKVCNAVAIVISEKRHQQGGFAGAP